MKLYCTPLSHFSRKVRIVADFYNLNLEYIDVGSVTEIGTEKFARNPLMAVPVLIDHDLWIIDSDQIISFLVDKNDPSDRLKFKIIDIESLNIRTILNGIMSNEVKIIQGNRSGIPIQEYNYFKKAKLSIEDSLKWLNERADKFSINRISFQEIHLVCALDHIKYFEIVDLEKYGEILNVVEVAKRQSFIKRSDPFLLKPKNMV